MEVLEPHRCRVCNLSAVQKLSKAWLTACGTGGRPGPLEAGPNGGHDLEEMRDWGLHFFLCFLIDKGGAEVILRCSCLPIDRKGISEIMSPDGPFF